MAIAWELSSVPKQLEFESNELEVGGLSLRPSSRLVVTNVHKLSNQARPFLVRDTASSPERFKVRLLPLLDTIVLADFRHRFEIDQNSMTFVDHI